MTAVSTSARLPAGSLFVRRGTNSVPFYEAKWRWNGAQVKRRVGPAWLDPDASGGWAPRRGRVPVGYYDEKRAIVRMGQLIHEHADRAEAAERRVRDKSRPVTTFRTVAHEWLEWLEQVRKARPSTLRDNRSTLAEPGARHRRGGGACAGRIMAAFGDRPIDTITTRDVAIFLREL